MAEVTIPARFNGPAKSGQGGYSSGLLAGMVEGHAAVSLRRPVPLDTPLQAVADGAAARLLHGGELIAEAEQAPDFELEPPSPVALGAARRASRGYRGRLDGLFSHCFVCGWAREDSFEVFAGPVEGRDVVATPWTPPDWSADESRRVRPELVWAALDCPAYFAAYRGTEGTVSFLARMTARIDVPVAAGEEHVVVAWPLAVNGRKRRAGSAVLSAAGEPLAVAEALMIEPRPGAIAAGAAG